MGFKLIYNRKLHPLFFSATAIASWPHTTALCMPSCLAAQPPCLASSPFVRLHHPPFLNSCMYAFDGISPMPEEKEVRFLQYLISKPQRPWRAIYANDFLAWRHQKNGFNLQSFLHSNSQALHQALHCKEKRKISQVLNISGYKLGKFVLYNNVKQYI